MRAQQRLLVFKVLRAPVYNNSVGAAGASDNFGEVAKALRAPVYNNSLEKMRVSAKAPKCRAR